MFFAILTFLQFLIYTPIYSEFDIYLINFRKKTTTYVSNKNDVVINIVFSYIFSLTFFSDFTPVTTFGLLKSISPNVESKVQQMTRLVEPQTEEVEAGLEVEAVEARRPPLIMILAHFK